MAAKPSRDMLIHCDSCGEDYSSTYRRCPFCGAKNDPRRMPREDDRGDAYYDDTAPLPVRQGGGEEMEDGYVFDGQDAFDDDQEGEDYYAPRPKGGKRLAPKQGGFDLPPINWPRLITFLCSLVIIVAALVIVFTFIYPQLRGHDDPNSENSAEVSSAPSQDPSPAQSQDVGQIVDTSAPEGPSAPVQPVTPVQPAVTGISLTSNGYPLSANDITLYVGESAQMGAVVTPSDWSGQVTWTSSNPEWIAVSDTGLVTNVNDTGAYHNAFLTITAGEMSIRCEVRVSSKPRTTQAQVPASDPPATQAPASDPPATQAPTTSGSGPVVGQTGTIVGADGGLRVRSGPGTTNEVLASLANGDTVTVLADAGGGWYQISFPGSGGTTTGYIMGEYISSN